MISRKMLKLAEIILAVGAILFFVGFLFDITPLWIGGAAVIVAGLAVLYFTSRCPNCKKFIRDLSSAQEEGAHCKHCGETFEIKD